MSLDTFIRANSFANAKLAGRVSHGFDNPRKTLVPRAGGAAVFLYATAIWSATVHGAATQLDAVVVTGSGSETASGELGATASASQGVVDQRTLQSRPLSRVGELVEVVPGAVATQHSGSGKANQFFLRGFNLDHGTDFSVAVDGVPMNMPSHAHGQGYLDLNSIIPELVDHADYGKGPYHADVGDFASAGYARMYTADSLPQGFVKFTGGEFGYYRTVAADSQKLGQGELLYAGEAAFYDGPWKTPEGSGKYNGLLKYSLAQDDWGLSLVGKAIMPTGPPPTKSPNGRWIAAWSAATAAGFQRRRQQQPLQRFRQLLEPRRRLQERRQPLRRLLRRGTVLQFHLLPRRSGARRPAQPKGAAHRAGRQRRTDLVRQGLRRRYGQQFGSAGAARPHHGLHAESQRKPSGAAYPAPGRHRPNQCRPLRPQPNPLAGKIPHRGRLARGFFVFDVHSRTLAQNSGNQSAAMFSPKLSLIFGPWFDTEFFVNLGEGFHSNDARGVTLKLDPLRPDTPVPGVDPLVKTRGAEVGLRSQWLPGLDTTLAVWWLQVGSELVFVGDAGTTEPTGKSERYGVEWTNTYRPADWLTLDGELALTSARFVDAPAHADAVPNSVGG